MSRTRRSFISGNIKFDLINIIPIILATAAFGGILRLIPNLHPAFIPEQYLGLAQKVATFVIMYLPCSVVAAHVSYNMRLMHNIIQDNPKIPNIGLFDHLYSKVKKQNARVEFIQIAVLIAWIIVDNMGVIPAAGNASILSYYLVSFAIAHNNHFIMGYTRRTFNKFISECEDMDVLSNKGDSFEIKVDGVSQKVEVNHQNKSLEAVRRNLDRHALIYGIFDAVILVALYVAMAIWPEVIVLTS